MGMQTVLSSGLAPRVRACLLPRRLHPVDRIFCPLTDIVLVIVRVVVYLKFGCREKRPVSSRKVHYRRKEDSVRRVFWGVKNGNLCCNS
jgi:hypothetical protein